ncbi:hypothetical protein [Roseivirga sp. E12]|uniref:hypothetical protein n=1 Tax=Roseivirga sp. E12 TaxID=2819237 RepID=UPI001ABC2B94|nr:hypothetical protein [Roseivirga sp. E12]MBO3700470.1 hypothetical protein [Roseivirga sp. E12]
MKRLILILIFTLPMASFISAQELKFGNEDLSKVIKEKVSAIYETKGNTQFFMTSESFQSTKTLGTEIIAYSSQGIYNRVITKGFSKNGLMATEWFFEENKLIFVFEVFEYFEESNKKSNWRNFKGISSWEGRYYFHNDELVFYKHTGRESIAENFNGKRLVQLSKQLKEFLTKN